MTESQTKSCQNCKQNFTIEPDDFAFYDRMQVPPPTFCSECRMIRRFMFRNEHYLYRNKDLVTGKEIFSGIPPHSPYKIYSYDYWVSDAWDPMDYGREYDFSKPFFEQFRSLMRDVPWNAKTVLNVVNSDYSDQASYLKNCYLCFDVDHVDDAAYLVNSGFVKDSADLLSSLHDELCYEDIMVNNSYRTLFSYNCDNCNNVWFSKNCTDCTDCFGCVNLKSKKYHIFNQPFSKEEYEKAIKDFNLDSRHGLTEAKGKVREVWKKFPEKSVHGFRNIGSSGDYLNDTKDVRDSYVVQDAQNVKFGQLLFYGTKDSYDFTIWSEGSSWVYEAVTCGIQCNSIKFCFDCWPASQNLEYCVSCRSSSDLFGCVGLKKKQYCIFNKQYSKEEYFALRERIIRQMSEKPYQDARGNSYKYGEFFPPEFSPFAYNETFAQDLFPLTKEAALAKGYSWQDPDSREFQTTLAAESLPDKIADASDSLLREIIACSSCRKAYRFIDFELNLYRRLGLPLPRNCFACRLKERYAMLNQPRLFSRSCQCAGEKSHDKSYTNQTSHSHGTEVCPNMFETSHGPDSGAIVYCDSCYLSETA